MDPAMQRVLLGIAHALYMNRLHVLQLTEVVRLGIKPDRDDGTLQVPPKLMHELREQAFNFVLTFFPPEFADDIRQAKFDWQPD
jgi:hypothetical protein